VPITASDQQVDAQASGHCLQFAGNRDLVDTHAAGQLGAARW
jgi:hypothetical protein